MSRNLVQPRDWICEEVVKTEKLRKFQWICYKITQRPLQMRIIKK